MQQSLRRVSVTVPLRRAEEARATMLELFPEGFEEIERSTDVELAAYTDAAGEELLWHAFGGVRTVSVADGWEERWQRFHRPVEVGPLWIGPPWEPAPPRPEAIVIDPGRAFGTGTHATTRLCLKILLDLPRGSLLDVGCGSGVLSIAAVKLGFAPVYAVDIDPVAVEAAERNAVANDTQLDVSLVDVLRDPVPSTMTTVANISLEVVAALARKLECPRLVTSGYLVSETLDIDHLRHVRRVDAHGWAADLWEAGSE